NVYLLAHFSVRDRAGGFRLFAYLARHRSRERVDVVRQVLPGAADPLDLSLAAELALGTHLAGDARHLVREGRELVDHDVDGVLELEDLAPRLDRDLLREIAGCDRGSHLRDVANVG